MGILETPAVNDSPISSKRKSTDFSKLGPLSKFGTVGFTGYREQQKPKRKETKGADDHDMDDSDAEDDDTDKKRANKDDDEPVTESQNGQHLSPLDPSKQGELTEGVRKIQVR